MKRALLVIIFAGRCFAAQDNELMKSVRARDVVGVRRALQSGVDVKARAHDGWTALHWACMVGDEPIAALLLNAHHGIDLGKPDVPSALHIAATQGHVSLIKMLIKNGFPVDAVDSQGQTPLMCAVFAGKHLSINELLASGALLDAADRNGNTALHYAFALGFDVSARQFFKITYFPAIKDSIAGTDIFISSAHKGFVGLVSLFLDHGSDLVHPRTKLDQLSRAALTSNREIAFLIKTLREFLDNPDSALNEQLTVSQLKQYLIWSIAYHKVQAYKNIEKMRPDLFQNTTILIRLFLHAAKMGTSHVVKDSYHRLKKSAICQNKRLQIVLNALFLIAQNAEMTDLLHEIVAEDIACRVLTTTK